MDPEDDLFLDPEDAEVDEDEESKNQEDDVETDNPEQREEEEDDEQMLAAWMSHCRAAEKEKEEEKTTKNIDRKISFDPPSRPRADRRASLPCPAQLSAMQLSRLHSATKAPTPARALRTRDDQGPATPINTDRRPSVISTIPEVAEVPERKARFRRRNVVSLSDADRICLICYNDLNNGGSGVKELPCSHSFHSECIEEWLWRKKACPTCRVQVPMPQPLYWSSARVKVP